MNFSSQDTSCLQQLDLSNDFCALQGMLAQKTAFLLCHEILAVITVIKGKGECQMP